MISDDKWIQGRFLAFWREDRPIALALAGGGLLLVAYAVVFLVTGEYGLPGAVGRAAVNVGPAAVLAILVFRLLNGAVLRRSLALQAAAHVALAFVFAIVWYFLITAIGSVSGNWLSEGFTARPFSRVAFIWQMFQGVTVYAIVALFTYTVALATALETARAEIDCLSAMAPKAEEAAKPERGERTLVVKLGDTFAVLPFEEIVRLSAAGNKTLIVTRSSRFETGTPLTQFEKDLPADEFLRAHRSHIIRLGAILSAEPAGNGRLTFHLSADGSVTASRTGTQAFRARAL